MTVYICDTYHLLDRHKLSYLDIHHNRNLNPLPTATFAQNRNSPYSLS